MIWDQIKTWLVNLCTLGALLEKYSLQFLSFQITIIIIIIIIIILFILYTLLAFVWNIWL